MENGKVNLESDFVNDFISRKYPWTTCISTSKCTYVHTYNLVHPIHFY